MFFDRTISLSGQIGSRTLKTSVRCCLVDDGTGDPITEEAYVADSENISAFVRQVEWPERDLPTAGFSLVTDDGATYAVRRVTRLGDTFAISARRTK